MGGRETIKVPGVEPFEIPSKAETVGTQTCAAKPRLQPSRPSTRNGCGRYAGGEARNNGSEARAGAVEVIISGATKSLVVRDAAGKTVMHAPVTVGSSKDPLPVGDWKVTGVSWNPTFNYNPDLFWDADPTHAKAKIPAGPNNPVGVVWVDINKEHFGLHGTPEPSTDRPYRIAWLHPPDELGCDDGSDAW